MTTFQKKHQANLDAALLALLLDRDASASLQVQLSEALRGLILSHPEFSQARLPASRKLAAELSVSRTTVQGAYDQLLGEGYLVSRRGSGTFVAGSIPHLSAPPARDAGQGPAPLAWRPFQIGATDQNLFPHRSWARHLEKAWRAPEPALLARPDPFGWRPLRAAIADHLAAWRGLDCDPEQVLILSGAWEAFDLICRGVLGPGEVVAVEDPGWGALRDVLAACGAGAHPIRVDADGLNAAAIPKGAKAVVVTPSRHFPTGAIMPLARRAALLSWAEKTGGLVVEDDYDSEFRFKGAPLPSLSGLDGLRRTIYLGSYSKLLSPALRISYLALPAEHVEQARRYLERVGAKASLIPQPALASFMSSGEFAAHLRRMRRVYAKRQSRLVEALGDVDDLIDVEAEPAGMHLCACLRPKLRGRISDQELVGRAEEEGLALRALSDYSVSPDPPQGLLLGFAAFEEDALIGAARSLAALLRRSAAR